jgi:hypothetical protein
MCGYSSKTKSEIMKHYQKYHLIFFISHHRSWDFKPLLEKEKTTSVDSSSNKPKALIRNIGCQPFKLYMTLSGGCWTQGAVRERILCPKL